jgi:hypothetical protein
MHYPNSLSRPAWVAAFYLISACAAHGSTFTFSTPFGASDPGGNPINATAVFQSAGPTELMITLQNNQANPRDDGQMLVDFSFRVNQTLTGVTMMSLGTPIEIGGDGSWIYLLPTHTDSTMWDLTSSAGASSTVFAFCDNPGLAGCAQGGADWPERGLIGPPNAQNIYSNANGSITTGAHEPVLWETATFWIDLPAGAQLSSNLQITDVRFAFGTLSSPQTFSGTQVQSSNTSAVPEPGPQWMIAGGLGLVFLGALGRRRWTRQNARRNPN